GGVPVWLAGSGQDGGAWGSVTTGADGSFYFAVDPFVGFLPDTDLPGAVVVYLDEATAGAQGATASDDFSAGDGSITGLGLTAGTVAWATPRLLCGEVIDGVFAVAGDSTVDPRIPYAIGSLDLAPGLALDVDAVGASFTIDEAMVAPLDVSVTSAGPLTIGAA